MGYTVRLYVSTCVDCGYTIADPDNKLDPYHVIIQCPKCGCSPSYRPATFLEKIKYYI
ncbi:MAG: hypothetical protein FWH29_03350 [Methanobrevibacter sp.]|nr:hypothetical protein [Methanobrevibacter sp.]